MFNAAGLQITKRNVKPTVISCVPARENKGCDNKELVQRLKIDLANIDYASVIKYISNEENLDKLNKEGIYVGDIDFTQDFKGVFNKKKLTEYLLSIGYRLQKDEHRNDFEEHEEIKGTILDNNQHVSKNCLTFITTTETGKTRYKIYNKFVQCMESPSVRGKIGHHIKDWINNPEKVLQEAIPKSLETGLLRLEITFYRNEELQTLTEKEIKREMATLRDVLVPEQIYHNPINEQWNLLCDKVKNNLVIVDTDNKVAFVVIYQNRLTSKINGFYVDKLDKLDNIAKDFTWNVPLTVILYNTKDDKISIQQDTYVKSKTKQTLLSNGSDNFKVSFLRPDEHVEKTLNKPQNVGLLENDKVNLFIPERTWTIINKDTVFAQIDGPLLNYPTDGTIRTQNRDIREAETSSTFQQKNADKIKKLEEINIEINKEAEVARHKLQIKKIIDSAFESRGTQKFKDIQDGTRMFIYGFKFVELSTFGQSCILIYSLDKRLKEDTILYSIYATTNVKNYLEKSKHTYTETTYKGELRYATYDVISIAAIEKDGYYYNSSNNKCPCVKILDINPNKQLAITKETKEQLHKMEDIPLSIKIKDCKKVEDLEEGKILEVRGYRSARGSLIVNLSGTYYIGSYWLKEIVLKQANNQTYNVISGPPKTTPTKNKCRTFIKQ